MKKILTIAICAFLFGANLYSQQLSIFDIYSGDYPKMKAHFYAYDYQKKLITNLSISDFSMKEVGKPRTITNIECPSIEENIPLSSVLTIDVSGSMANNQALARVGATTWFDVMNFKTSECAITTFDSKNYFIQDLTNNKILLTQQMQKLNNGSGGTSFDAALISPKAGALLVLEKAQNKKVVIFITDGAGTVALSNDIVNSANDMGASIYAIILNGAANNVVQDLCEQTSGMYFDNISTEAQIKEAYLTIFQRASNNKPCTVEWLSEAPCENIGSFNGEFGIPYLKTYTNFSYDLPSKYIKRLEFSPASIAFGNVKSGDHRDTTITVSCFGSDINVTKINSTNSKFVVSPTSFFIKSDSTQIINLRYNSDSDSLCDYTTLSFENNACNTYDIFARAGTKRNPSDTTNKLKITFPNGGERLIVGTDTNITWEGMLRSDNVKIDYSLDGGSSWRQITDTATNLSYLWKQIPKPTSLRCLARVTEEKKGRLFVTLVGHTDTVTCIAISPDGTMIASGSKDKNIKMWDMYSYQQMYNIRDKAATSALCFNRDGSALASGNYFNILNKWSPIDGAPLWDTILPKYNDEYNNAKHYPISTIHFDSSGNQMVTANMDRSIQIWDANTNVRLKNYYGLANFVTFAYLCPDQRKILCGGEGFLKFRSTQNGDSIANVIKTLTGHDSVTCGDLSPDGNLVCASGGAKDFTVGVWRVYSGVESYNKMVGHTADVTALKFSPDGTKIVSGSKDKTVRIWDVKTLSLLRTYYGHTGAVTSVTFTPNGQIVASGSADSTVKIWDANFDAQCDTSDALFAIVAPSVISHDINMRQVIIGERKDSVIVDAISNEGYFETRIDTMFIAGAEPQLFELSPQSFPFVVPMNETKSIKLSFKPRTSGLHYATLMIVTQSDTLEEYIEGEGVIPSVKIVNKLIDFGVVELHAFKDTVQAVTIVNTSISDINIRRSLLGSPNDSDFSISKGLAPFVLKRGDTCKMDLRFTPSFIGRTSGTLNFYYDGVGSPAIIVLYGEGADKNPKIRTKMDSIANLSCADSTSEILKINNFGGNPLIISSISIKGEDSLNFKVANDTATLAKDSSIYVKVDFIPQSYGEKNAYIEIISNAVPDSVLKIYLNARKDTIALASDVSIIDLGYLCPNTSVDTSITIFNKGTIATGAYLEYTANLAIDTTNFTIDTAAHFTLPVKFLGLSQEGKFSERVRLVDSICGKETIVIIQGEISYPRISTSGTTITTILGGSKTAKLQIINNSNRDATVSSSNANTIGAPFELVGVAFPVNIPAGDTVSFQLVYTPNDSIPDTLNIQLETMPCASKDVIAIIGIPVSSYALLKIDSIFAYPNELINVPIIQVKQKNLGFSGATSFKTDLFFNPSMLSPIDYTKEKISETQAKITISNLPIYEENEKTLATVKFRTALGNAETCDLTFGNYSAVDGLVDLQVVNGHFKLLGVCHEGGARLVNANGATLLALAPNPSGFYVNVSYELREDARTELYIVNMLGERVLNLFDCDKNAGKYEEKYSIAELASGEYLLILKTANDIQTNRIEIMK